jgi:hypothetical protein
VNKFQVSTGVVPEGSRSQGFRGSSEMLKNYKELNVWQKSYKLCLNISKITAKNNIAERERMLKALIRSLENKHLNP